MNETTREHIIIGFNSTADRERRLRIASPRANITNTIAKNAIEKILSGNAIAYGEDFSEKLDTAKYFRIYTNSTNKFDPIFFE